MSLLKLLFPIVALGLARNARADPPVCSSSDPLSCHNTTALTSAEACCTEVQGQVLQVQFWDTDPATGPTDSWTIHGLWPDYCDGSYTSYCDESRQYTNISCILEAAGADDTLDYMMTYWKDDGGEDETFWEHEWGKHGTCYSTLKPSCFPDYVPFEEVVDFFTQTVDLFKTLPTYEWLANASITPSSTKKYTNEEFMAALRVPRGVNATLSCEDGAIYQIEYTFNVMGSVADGTFVAAEPVGEGTDGCGSSFMYLPKNESTVPEVSATTCPAENAVATAATSRELHKTAHFTTQHLDL